MEVKESQDQRPILQTFYGRNLRLSQNIEARRYDTQHNDTYRNATRCNDSQHNYAQRSGNQHNHKYATLHSDTRYICWVSFLLSTTIKLIATSVLC